MNLPGSRFAQGMLPAAGYRVARGNRPATKASFLPAMASSRRMLMLVFAAALAGGLPARENFVTASAIAGADYQRPKDAAGSPRPESYVFAEGKFFEGVTVDRGLEKATFADITRPLVTSLAKQNYYPAADMASAQLLIMVHWGATTTYEDPQKDINQAKLNDAISNYNASIDASGKADPSELNMALGSKETAQEGTTGAINRNAVLLGYAHHLEKQRKESQPTTEEITMSNELNEERYFVILMAYDNQLRQKEHKSRVLWITRLSVRSPGNNFPEALPALAKVGSEVFGQQLDDLVRVKASMNPGKVTLGETQFTDTSDPKNPPAKKEK